jgi:hypothetical protein
MPNIAARSPLTTEPDRTSFDGPGPAPNTTEAPGLAEQLRRTRASFSRLISAHVALLRAELGAILALIGSMAAKAGIILGLALLMGMMLYIGGLLFIGEWLFGSIGWGLAHGVLLPIGLIVALGLGIVGGTRGPALISFFVVLLIVIGVALLLGMNVAWESAGYFAAQLEPPLDTPGAIGAIAGALVLGLLMLLLFWRLGGIGGAIFGLVLGALLGALIGFAFTIDRWTWGPAVGLAITLGLILWPLLNVAITWPRLDVEAHFARLKPTQSMEAAAETRAWLEKQWQTKSPLRGRK